MTLEELESKLESKIAKLGRDVANAHQFSAQRYGDLDKRLDSKLGEVAKSKWTPICVALYTAALLWAGMAIERWF